MTTVNDIEFIIAAAGNSTRNYPQSKGLPHKCLLPFGSHRIIDFILRDIINVGGKHITMIVSNKEIEHAFRHAFADDRAIQDKLAARGEEGREMAAVLKEVEIPEDVNIKYVIQEVPMGTAQCMALANEVAEGRHGLMIFPDDVYISKDVNNTHINKIINHFLVDTSRIVASGVKHEDISRFGVLMGKRIVEKPENPQTDTALFSPFIFPKALMDHAERTMSEFLKEGKEWYYVDAINNFLDTDDNDDNFKISMFRKDDEDMFLDTGTRPYYEETLLMSLLLLSSKKDEHIRKVKDLLNKIA